MIRFVQIQFALNGFGSKFSYDIVHALRPSQQQLASNLFSVISSRAYVEEARVVDMYTFLPSNAICDSSLILFVESCRTCARN